MIVGDLIYSAISLSQRLELSVDLGVITLHLKLQANQYDPEPLNIEQPLSHFDNLSKFVLVNSSSY